MRRIVCDLSVSLLAVSLFLTTYDESFLAGGVLVALVGALVGRWRRKDTRMSDTLMKHLLIIATIAAVGGWLGVALLLTMLAQAAH